MSTEQKNTAVEMSFNADNNIATLTLKMEGRANKINEDFGTGLLEAVEWAHSLDNLEGIIITSGHKDFCVGADIDSMFVERNAAKVLESTTKLNALFNKIETSKQPVVVALNGSALGGGFELALACHRRIALDNPTSKFGLPEVTLGLIPGAGGTQRLPRLVGIQTALDFILQGKMVRPSKALQAKLIDELAESKDQLIEKSIAWIKSNKRFKQPWLKSDYSWPTPQPGSEDARNMILAACGMLYKKTAGCYPAHEAATCAVQEGSLLRFDRALEVEGRYFAGLAVSDQAKDMIRTIWYHRTAAEKHEGLPTAENDEIEKIGILGAGMMGAGLAFICAQAGYSVVLKDINDDALEKGMEHCRSQLKKMKWLSDEEKNTIIGRINPSLDLAALEECDLIVEAVIENLKVKHAVITETEGVLSDRGIWASNTSALPINDLATASKIKDKFIGLHFFSPVEKMPLIEIILGKETSQETLGRVLAFSKKIKKTPIVVNDGYGFYTTRVFSAYIMEAAQLVAEGHDPVLVEWAAKSAGMVVPPLQVFDEVTLTLARHGLEQAKDYMKHSQDLEAISLIQKMVDVHERNGKSSGKGFYEYKNGKRTGFWKGLSDLVNKPRPDNSSVALITERLMLAQCVEVVRSLEEGVLRNHRDAEVGALLGIGFAPNRGGPLAYLDRLTASKAVADLSRLHETYGERFKVPKLLKQMAAKGETFFET